MKIKKIIWVGAVCILYFITTSFVSANVLESDLNDNGVFDSEEEEVVVSVNKTLSAGEYNFKNLVVTNSSTLFLERGENLMEAFKGVKINAINLIVDVGSSISSDGGNVYGTSYGQGVPPPEMYQVGASYGGKALNNNLDTYGSATKPIDLGSDGYYKGGGAIWFLISNTLINNGSVSASGGLSASGGSIYIVTKNLDGDGIFSANGGGLFASGYYKSPGGGGRVAIYFENNSFSGVVEAKGGCGSYDGWSMTCSGNGTAGLFDTINNNLFVDLLWRFQKNDGPFVLNNIYVNNAKIENEEGVNIKADELRLDNKSSIIFAKNQVINISTIDIDNSSTATLSGQEFLNANFLNLKNYSVLTVLQENKLYLKIPNINILTNSSISADGKGYGQNSGPGASIEYRVGASYGGIGSGNTPESIYGSELEPVDFGSGGDGYHPSGGGAIKIESDNLVNDGVISANGLNTSSGGSIYVVTKNLSGGGLFSVNGGEAYCPNVCFGPGGGGRIAIYYENNLFSGVVEAKGKSVYGGTSGDGTVVMKQVENRIDPVIIIPGIMGSSYKNGKLVIDPILHTYDDLIATLKVNGYVESKDLFVFPYEWRDSNITTANLLKDKIDEVKNICRCQKVDLVAHSMGGLVAREYIQSGRYENDVDQVIFLGTPHKGSADSYLTWEAGEFRPDNKYKNIVKLKFTLESYKNGYLSLFDYIHNRPISSVQELLPIFDYIKDKDTGLLRNYPNNYPRNAFLEYLNIDSNIKKLLDSVRITNIVGNVGDSSTIKYIRVTEGSDKLWVNGKPDGFDSQTNDRGLEMGVGDGTVTSYSSTISNTINNEVLNNIEHQDLPKESSDRVYNILTNKTVTSVIYLTPIEKILSISLQSPIDVLITAPDGKKVGKNFLTNEEYNEIEGAFYSGFNNGDDEYITIPNPLNGDYKIEVIGTGDGGKYGISTSYISDNFSTTTEIIGTTKTNQITELSVGLDDENIYQEKVVTFEVLLNDIDLAYTLGWIKSKTTKDLLLKQVKNAIKFSQKVVIIKDVRNQKFEIKVNKILARIFLGELEIMLKKKMISNEAYNLIKSDVLYLINK